MYRSTLLFLLLFVTLAQAEIVDTFPYGGFTYVANEYGNKPEARRITGPFDRGYQAVPPSQTYWLDYWLKLKKGWVEGRGGKVLGLGPKRPTTGCNDIKDTGWSVRMMWGPLRSYEYHQNRKSTCGDSTKWPDNKVLPIDQWTRITQYVKVNKPGKADGVVKWWLNGVEVDHRRDVELRGNVGENTALIERVLVFPFRGGNNDTWSVPVDTTMQFSNIYLLDCPVDLEVGAPDDKPRCRGQVPDAPIVITIPAGKNPVMTVTEKAVKVEFK